MIRQMVVFALECSTEDCTNEYIDADSEHQVVHPSWEKLIEFAVQEGWRVYGGRHFCPDECLPRLASQPHTFESDVDGFCTVCRGWFDDDRHTGSPVLPGQMELGPVQQPEPFGTTALVRMFTQAYAEAEVVPRDAPGVGQHQREVLYDACEKVLAMLHAAGFRPMAGHEVDR